jgi:polar amino acid transport system substrate-binding protein
MEDYQTDLTGAIADISLAIGRSSQGGVLGGIEGALATTSLGVPTGAKIVSGCSVPSVAPAYGVIAGTLAYLAVDRRAAAAEIPAGFPVRRIDVIGDRLVLYTSSAIENAKRCSHRVAEAPRAERSIARRSHRENMRSVVSASLVSYTASQAHAGYAVFAQNCVSCHGANLQGVAAPAVAGKVFVTQVTGDGWTVADLRNLVVQQMPLNNPGALSSTQYADVMAYLLASNCYAAGSAPFPKTDDPKLAKVKIHPPHGAKPNDAKLGTCRVK